MESEEKRLDYWEEIKRLASMGKVVEMKVDNPCLKFPRNGVCPICDSGRKYKKCCLPRMPRRITPSEREGIRKWLTEMARRQQLEAEQSDSRPQ